MLLQQPIKPIKDGRIGTTYGVTGPHWSWRRNSEGKWFKGFKDGKGEHTGYDFACIIGTKCYAVVDGMISYQDFNKTIGLFIILAAPDHINITYAHLSRSLVKDGQKVKQGELIGETGKTGNVTGPHLHQSFRDSKTGNWFPVSYLPNPSAITV